jgi:hypothetical protein
MTGLVATATGLERRHPSTFAPGFNHERSSFGFASCSRVRFTKCCSRSERPSSSAISGCHRASFPYSVLTLSKPKPFATIRNVFEDEHYGEQTIEQGSVKKRKADRILCFPPIVWRNISTHIQGLHATCAALASYALQTTLGQ